jgi:endogenous inhibitor of DNA gyrase (YacG/DUF329 family)
MSGIGKKPGEKQTGGTGAGLPLEPRARQSAKLVPLRPRRKCPICGKKAARTAYPFCSVQCADIDLDRWLSGRYRVASSADGDDAPPARDPPAGYNSDGDPDGD